MRLFSVLAAAAALLAFCGLSRSKIAAFNIQKFGEKKYSNYPQHVMDTVVKIVLRYDLIFIQEVFDKDDKVLIPTLKDVNSAAGGSGDVYAMKASERLGRSHQKEKYVYFYKKDKVEVSEVFVSKNQKFERPPYIARVKLGTGASSVPPLEFIAIGVHTKPTAAVAEVNELVNVYDEAVNHFKSKIKHAQRALLMGDFNTGVTFTKNKIKTACNMGQNDFNTLKLKTDKRFKWLIDEVTNIKRTCAHDKFVAAGGLEDYVSGGSATVFPFDTAMGWQMTPDETKEVSDHFPIELVLDDSPSSGVATTVAGATVLVVAVVAGRYALRNRRVNQAAPP